MELIRLTANFVLSLLSAYAGMLKQSTFETLMVTVIVLALMTVIWTNRRYAS